jgi:signal transduction histidine kinase
VKLLWPGGLTGRVALLLALSLLVVQVISIPYYLSEQARTATDLFEQSNGERVARISRMMDGLTNEQRREILPALNSPSLALELLYHLPDTPLLNSEADLARVTSLSETLRRPLQLRQFSAEDDAAGLLSGLFASRELIAIWVPLDDGAWLRFVTASALPSLGWIMHLSAQVFLVSLAVVAFAIWAARQMTRPIRTFAAAAERLGRDVQAPPIGESGSRELRRATRAFNTMQQRLQRYVEDRTQMLAAISHDLRTSLTRLQLRTTFIEDPEQRRKAEQDIQEMEAMLSATLTFARDDAADEPLTKVDIASMLHSLCDDLSDIGKPVRYRGPESLTCSCRSVSLQRALANLMTNAASYGSEAEVCLSRQDQAIQVVIVDRGPGIDDADKERVFEPFVRLDSARSRVTGGSGLGLPIARSVVHAHGGTLSLVDREGGGLEVVIELPQEQLV